MASSLATPTAASGTPLIGELSHTVFANGLQVYVREQHDAAVASLQLWVRTGSIHEGEWLGCGISHFLEHMMFQGSEHFPGNEIAATVHRLGGEMNAYTSYGCTVYYIDILSEAAPTALKILADVLMNPCFPEAEFAREKEVILRERAMIRDIPDRCLAESLWRTMFTVHPAKHPIIGYEELIRSVDCDMMNTYYRRRYSPERAFFMLVGDIDAEKSTDLLRKQTENWPRRNLDEPRLPEEPPQSCSRQHSFTFADPLARLACGFHVPAASHHDIPALDLLAAVLGQGKSSRLFSQLHDEQELALQVDAFNYSPYFTGLFGISATSRPENLPRLRDGIFKQIENISRGGVRPEELQKTIRQAVTGHLRSLQSNSHIARLLGESILSFGTPEYVDRYIDDLKAVSRDDMVRVSEQYLRESRRNLVEQLPEAPSPAKKARGRRHHSSTSGKCAAESCELAGGIRLITLPDNRLPLVDICLILPGGGIWENRKLAGISRLTAEILTCGTASFSESELAQRLDQNAIHLNISAGNNTFCIQCNVHREDLAVAAELLASVLAEPTFPEPEFERCRRNHISSLQSRALNPQRAAEDALLKGLYGEHPYAFPSVGLEDSVAAMNREQLREFYYESCLAPQQAVFGIAGDLAQEEMHKFIADLAGRIPWSRNCAGKLPELPRFPATPLVNRVSLPREQSVIMLGIPACDNHSQDRFALDLLQTAAGGLDSRLFRRIRGDAGLAYYTGLFASVGMQNGFLAFYAGTRPDATDQVIGIIDRERHSLATHGLEKEEFISAKARLQHGFTEQQLSNANMILHSALGEFYGNGFQEPWKAAETCAELKKTDVDKAIRKYLANEATVTAIAGPDNG